MITRNLAFSIFCYAFFGIYTELQVMIFSTLPGPLNVMYNNTLINHFGVHADEKSLSLFNTITSMGMMLGTIPAVTILLPFMDKRGRKFLVVKARFLCGATTAICQVTAGLLQAAEFYVVGQVFLGISLVIQTACSQLYLAECAPDAHRGLVTTTLLTGNVISSIIGYLIFNPNILGTSQSWPIIPAVTLMMSFILFLSTCALPESPKWLVGEGKEELARKSIRFYHGDAADVDEVLLSIHKEVNLTKSDHMSVREVVKDESIREAVYLIMACSLFSIVSCQVVEAMYSVVLHTTLGMTAEQSLTLNLIVHLFLSPMRFMGTILMDKLGRRPVVLLASTLAMFKVLSMLLATSLVLVSGPSIITIWIAILNELLSELFISTGVGAIPTLLIAELMPPSARIAAFQAVLVVPLAAAISVMSFPILNAYCPPAYYGIILCVQPWVIGYLYRNLPETKGRSVYDIIHTMEEEVRSRANTRLSICTENSHLISRRRTLTYSAFNHDDVTDKPQHILI